MRSSLHTFLKSPTASCSAILMSITWILGSGTWLTTWKLCTNSFKDLLLCSMVFKLDITSDRSSEDNSLFSRSAKKKRSCTHDDSVDSGIAELEISWVRTRSNRCHV